MPKIDNRTNIIATLLVVLSGVFISALIANAQRTNFDNRVSDFESRLLLQFQNTLSERLSSYEQTLLSARTLFVLDDSVARSDWEGFYDGQEINRRLPGTLGVGFAQYVPREEVQSYTQQLREEGMDNFKVTPETKNAVVVPVTYIEPFNSTTRSSLGYDMFSETARREAMRRSVRENSLAMTQPVDLAANSDSKTRGVVLYLPVYDKLLRENVDTTQVAPVGFVFAVVDINNLMTQLFGANNLRDNRFAVQINDVSNEDGGQVFKSTGYEDIVDNNNTETVSLDFNIVDRLWQLNILVDKEALISSSVTPMGIIITGISLSVLIGSFIYTAMINRLRLVESSHEMELQKTKDELLALASHQLRTPATAVKQYVGMILQGYSGKISKEQKTMLTKAYNSNDRQIEIINHLLYVAKADAGELKIDKEVFDLTRLIREVVEDVKSQALKKGVKVQYSPGGIIEVNADQKFVRMIIENLVSNAIKYSEPDAEVGVVLKKKAGKAVTVVSDKGVGIAQADLSKLFQKFSRIENKYSRSEGGSGIGLYLAKTLADAHRGSITVSTKADEGSQFTFTLPTNKNIKNKLVKKGKN